MCLCLYTGWPNKNGLTYFPILVFATNGISGCGIFFWEKWYQDRQIWWSSFCFTIHFVTACWGTKFVLHCLLLIENNGHSSVPQLWAVIRFFWIRGLNLWTKEYLANCIGLQLTTVERLNVYYFQSRVRRKETILTSNMLLQNVS